MPPRSTINKKTKPTETIFVSKEVDFESIDESSLVETNQEYKNRINSSSNSKSVGKKTKAVEKAVKKVNDIPVWYIELETSWFTGSCTEVSDSCNYEEKYEVISYVMKDHSYEKNSAISKAVQFETFLSHKKMLWFTKMASIGRNISFSVTIDCLSDKATIQGLSVDEIVMLENKNGIAKCRITFSR